TGFTVVTGDSSAPRTATVEYRYVLSDAVDQPNAERTQDAIALEVTDQNDETSSGNLVIEILDDAPTAEDDARTIDEDSAPISGNVITGGAMGDVADR